MSRRRTVPRTTGESIGGGECRRAALFRVVGGAYVDASVVSVASVRVHLSVACARWKVLQAGFGSGRTGCVPVGLGAGSRLAPVVVIVTKLDVRARLPGTRAGRCTARVGSPAGTGCPAVRRATGSGHLVFALAGREERERGQKKRQTAHESNLVCHATEEYRKPRAEVRGAGCARRLSVRVTPTSTASRFLRFGA